MKIVTSNDIGGPWQSGKEEVNNNSRRKQNTDKKKQKGRRSQSALSRVPQIAIEFVTSRNRTNGIVY